ncbi:MAG: TRAP transporter substrate-binding protein DctP [Bacillota bacterium]|jgi:TRAP-type mannitol/chloroaromatic compound transport system substrate-binding protein
MKRFRFVALLALVLMLGAIVLLPNEITAKEKTWTLVGQAFCARANRLFELGEDFAYTIEKYTDGRVQIEFHQEGELVPANDVFSAAGDGIIDFGQGCPCLAKPKAYAAQWFCDAPGAQSPIEKIIWYYYGGGKEIFEQIMHERYNVHPLPMIAITAEIWLYANKEVKSLDDLKGLKMRAAGVRGEVLTEMGASVVVLPGSEMVPAMERGVIDAMEYSSINCTYPLGFCDVTEILYMHPYKSTSPINIWAFNLDLWNELPKDIQEAIERASRDTYLKSLAWGIMEDTVTLKDAVENKGVTIDILPEDVARAIDEASADFYYEKAKTDKDLALVLESWAQFKKDYGEYAEWIDYFNMTGDHLGLVKGDS